MVFVSHSISDVLLEQQTWVGAISSFLFYDPREAKSGNEPRLENDNLTSTPLDGAILQMFVLPCDTLGLTGDLDPSFPNRSKHSSADHSRLRHDTRVLVPCLPVPNSISCSHWDSFGFSPLSPDPHQITGLTLSPS